MDNKKPICPASTEEARDIVTFLQSFGYANACRDILKMVTEGELDLGPMASGKIAIGLAEAQKEASEHAEAGTRFIDAWDTSGERSDGRLHSLDEILKEVQ